MINLSKQIELKNPNLKYQTNAIDRLDEYNATIFFIIEKSEEKSFEFSHNAANATWFTLINSVYKRKSQKNVNILNGSDKEPSKLAARK